MVVVTLATGVVAFAFLALVLRGALGAVAVDLRAVAVVGMKEIHLNSSIIQKKIAPKDDLVIN